MRMRKSLFLAAAAAVAMASGSVSAQTGASFARKTITIYIANTAGGSYDLYARLIARNFGKHLPGTPTVVASNMPGGGGLICANYLYTVAPKDGTALGVLIETVAVEQALKDPGVRYDAAKFNWVGRVASSNNVHFQWHSSKVQSLEDAKKMETTVAGTGPGNMAEIMPKVLNAVVGTKLRTGFDAMVKDAAFIAEIDKLKVELDPYTGQQLQERAVKLLDVPDSVRRRAMAIFGRT
jgi:tripartite-type tricarboxylate transporter receptor subunit TctC